MSLSYSLPPRSTTGGDPTSPGSDPSPRRASLEEEAKLRELAESLAHVGTWSLELGVPGATGVWSNEMYRIFGIDEGTPMTGERYLAVVHPDDLQHVERIITRTVDTGIPSELEYRIRRSDGEVRWIYEKSTAVTDAQGTPVRLLGVTQDITSQRRSLEELRQSERRSRQMLEMSSIGIWRTDPAGLTTFTNARMAAMIGYEPEELLGRHCLDFVAPESLEASRSAFGRRAPVAEQLEVELRCKDGSPRYTLIENTPIVDANGNYEGELAMVVDVTSRRRAQEALGISEARMRLLLESSGEAMFGVDRDGKCVFANNACLRMLGYESQEHVLGKEMHALIHHTRRDGAFCAGAACRLHAGVIGATGVHVDDEVLWRADGTSFDAECRSFPVRIEGLRMSSVVSFVDITERKRAESALRQTQKMEAIGRLAGGVAHDFNNLLCIILTYTSFVLDALPASDPMRADVEEIRVAGERAAELTRHLLAFSRRQVLEPTVLDVEGVFGSVEKMLRRLLGEDIVLSFSAIDSPRVHADRGQLEQVLMNLAVNARDAMPEGGTLTMAASVVDIDAKAAAMREGIAPGEYVRLVVSDTGCGMTPDVCARIFEPFFTTKESGKGTGLGLSTVFGVVNQSGGTVSVSSAPGRGTRFEILLPHTRQEPKAVEPTKGRAEGACGRETILLVEDEEQVRTMVQAVLRRHGYEVIDVSNAGEALLVCEQHAESIHLLLTDVVLPRMSGRQLAERVAPLRPEMRVLYVSGYTDDDVFHRGVRAEGVAFLHKPFTPAALARKVRDVLDAEHVPAIAS